MFGPVTGLLWASWLKAVGRALTPLPLIVTIILGTVGNMKIQSNKSDLVLLPATMVMIGGCARTGGNENDDTDSADSVEVISVCRREGLIV
jgi:hypothetical protein